MQQRLLDPCSLPSALAFTVFGRLDVLAPATSGAPHYFFSHPPTLRVRELVESERERWSALPRSVFGVTVSEDRGGFDDRSG